MKLNNKGLTIVEIIIAVTLIAIVLLFLFSVLITVRNQDAASRQLANMLINQAILTKEVETDFIDYELIGIRTCADATVAPTTPGPNGNDSVWSVLTSTQDVSLRLSEPKGNCLKLIYNPAKTLDNVGYLMYYSYTYQRINGNPTTVYVIGYVRGEKRIAREVPLPSSDNGTVTRTCNSSGTYCAFRIFLPVYDKQGEDFSIDLSYTTNNKCLSESYKAPTAATCANSGYTLPDSNDKYNFVNVN